MHHNLTENQLKTLRWFVQKVKNGKLQETFEVVYMASNTEGTVFLPDLRREKIPNYIDMGAINALTVEDVFRKSFLTRDTSSYTLTRKAYEIADFDLENPNPWPKLTYIKETRRLITQHFDRKGLSEVCFDLGVNPDWVFGDKTNWPHLLLVHLYQENKLKELTPILRGKRPLVDWPDYPVDEEQQ